MYAIRVNVTMATVELLVSTVPVTLAMTQMM
jgi:hypothetical protein